MPDDLATVDLTGVEILSAGGPIHGVGSPPQGDHWSEADLRGIAEANRELADEIRAPNKIGHSDEQKLAGVTEGELPAIGWLDGASFRVSDDGKKLLADVKRVPATVAKLLKAGAYRSRSVELSRVKSQKTGKEYPWVTTGLAWLGSRLPAVKTLADVAALYEGDDTERLFVQIDQHEEHDLGRIFEAVLALASAPSVSKPTPADTRPRMADEAKKYTDEQRRKFAEATGVEEAKVTDEMLAGAGVEVPKVEEPKKEEPAQVRLEDEAIRALSEKTEKADERTRKLEEQLRVERRDTFIENDAIKTGKIQPGQREFIETLYDADPDKARKYVESLPVNQDLVRQFGNEDAGDEATVEAKRELEQKEYVGYAAQHLQIPEEELV